MKEKNKNRKKLGYMSFFPSSLSWDSAGTDENGITGAILSNYCSQASLGARLVKPVPKVQPSLVLADSQALDSCHF